MWLCQNTTSLVEVLVKGSAVARFDWSAERIQMWLLGSSYNTRLLIVEWSGGLSSTHHSDLLLEIGQKL